MHGDQFQRKQVFARVKILVGSESKGRQVIIVIFRTEVILNIIANFIRFQSFLIEPFMPSTSAKINFLLGLEERTHVDATLGKLFNHNEESFFTIFLGLT